MKSRESGMPDEPMWKSFFDPETTLRKLGLCAETGDVVDFGCGYGTFTLPAAKIVRSTVYGIEIDPDMIEATRAKVVEEHLSNVQLILRDIIATGTGLADNSIGYAMLFNILHCELPEKLLRETWRILIPNGLMAIMHWNFDAATPRGPSMTIRPRPEQCRQ